MTQLQPGLNELVFSVPTGWANAGKFQTFVRFRFSTTGTLTDGTPMQPTGEASDGEVEDYQISVIPFETDWGDAPDSYSTLAIHNGANHRISVDPTTGKPNLMLGSTITSELDGQPGPTASADAGDDGVNFSGSPLIQGHAVTIPITVSNSTGQQAYLNAWIDFNGDGVWTDNEKIADGVPVFDGENDLTFIVPNSAVLGNTFARFRLSTTQTLTPVGGGPSGETVDGEVEDYQVAILPPPAEIRGMVWNDLNGNRAQDAGESGQTGWTIYLDANNNGLLDAGERSTTTAADGSYDFYDVTPGTYKIREVPVTGWNISAPAAGFFPLTIANGDLDTDMNFGNHDVVSPMVTVNPLVTKNNTPTLTGTVSDPSPGTGIASVVVSVGGQMIAATVNGTTWSVAVPVALADGSYNVQATATDNSGNIAVDSTTNELIVDTVAPAATVTMLTTKNAKPTLTGTVSDPSPGSGIAGVTVVVNGQTLTAAVNGTTWTVAVPAALADGTYDVQATATDNAGNSAVDSTTNELIVDTKTPTVTVNSLLTNDNKPTLSGTVADADPSGGIFGVTIVVGGQTLTATVDGTIWTVAVPAALADGTYDVQATATDNAGNSAVDSTTGELIVDSKLPTVTVNPLITNSTMPTLSGTITDPSPSSGIAGVTVVVGGQALAATISGTTWSVAVPVALTDGAYNVKATATDNAGNSASDSTTNELIVDTAIPQVAVTPLATKISTPTLSGTVFDPSPSSGIAGVTVVVGGQTLAATVSGITWSVTVPLGLADGVYNVQATATDNAGNSASDVTTGELTIDSTSPVVTVNPLVTKNATPTLSGTVTDPSPGSGISSVTVVVGGQTLTAVVSGGVWAVSVPATLADKTYNVQATATDNAGNSGADVTTNELTVDTKNPFVTVNTLVTKNTMPTLSGTVSDPRPAAEISA